MRLRRFNSLWGLFCAYYVFTRSCSHTVEPHCHHQCRVCGAGGHGSVHRDRSNPAHRIRVLSSGCCARRRGCLGRPSLAETRSRQGSGWREARSCGSVGGRSRGPHRDMHSKSRSHADTADRRLRQTHLALRRSWSGRYLPIAQPSIILDCGSGQVPAGFLVFKTCGGSRCGPRWVRLPSTPAGLDDAAQDPLGLLRRMRRSQIIPHESGR